MRLDKFLKVSRIIKRRPIAKAVVDGGKTKLDGKVAKPSTEVKEGAILELEYYDRYFKFQVLEVPTGNVAKNRAADLIKVLDVRGIDKIDLESEEEIFDEKPGNI
ncbi:MAG: RNA-binding S4 domain-containing protein [Fusobacteriaceae bacterium]